MENCEKTSINRMNKFARVDIIMNAEKECVAYAFYSVSQYLNFIRATPKYIGKREKERETVSCLVMTYVSIVYVRACIYACDKSIHLPANAPTRLRVSVSVDQHPKFAAVSYKS